MNFIALMIVLTTSKRRGLELKIEVFHQVTIAYMRQVGPYGAENKNLMEKMKAYLKEKGRLENSVILGIPLDDPFLVEPKRLRYDVGLVIKENEETGLPSRAIADGPYAIFEVPHTVFGVTTFWNQFETLTASLPVDPTKPVIERYDAKKVANHRCEFCVPLQEVGIEGPKKN